MERVSLENEELEGANNVYLLDAGERTVLVDTGEPAHERTLRDALGEYGVALADVDDVLLTHWHPDHSGLAGTIHRAGDPTVRVHEADAPLVAGDEAAWREFSDGQDERLEAWGVPDAKREELLARRTAADVEAQSSPPAVTPFADGDAITVGESELTVVHTPGHTAGSVCVELDGGTSARAGREVVTGDTLLPDYTPNVGGTDARLDQPLDEYLGSLYDLVAADYERAWPGHREPIDDPTVRAHQIVAHHEQRAGEILEILERTGPAEVWTVCSELFGDLEAFHVLVGAGEADAHLAHLETQGDVERVGDRYRLAADVRGDLDDEVDTWSLSVTGSPWD